MIARDRTLVTVESLNAVFAPVGERREVTASQAHALIVLGNARAIEGARTEARAPAPARGEYNRSDMQPGGTRGRTRTVS